MLEGEEYASDSTPDLVINPRHNPKKAATNNDCTTPTHDSHNGSGNDVGLHNSTEIQKAQKVVLLTGADLTIEQVHQVAYEV